MLQVTISEFRKDIKKYSELVKEQDIIVVSNGKPVMRVSDPMKEKITKIKSLKGIAKTELNYEDILKEKLTEL
ncbi:MAG: hypothetical protein IKP88_07145 [Lachnospiraceae bacterium]|nr:hypothetical protein [Erysipelotrichaceae bacterium]MBR3352148.1 hypothetical protein [Erysipelotrichaceae bacterium]MBR4342465.1 hypothetical protein [Lachnospiraceae bacterium]